MNNIIRDDCLAILPSHVRVREGPDEIVMKKLADGKPHRAPRRAVSLAYAFDGFSTNDDFLVIELNYAFECILGEVFTHLLVAPSRHVTSQPPPRESNGHRCVECVASVMGPVSNTPSRARDGMKTNTVEQRLPLADDFVAQQDLRDTGMVETEFPYLEEGEVSSSESTSSETSDSSSGSRRLRKSKRNRSRRRRLRRRSTAVD
ncbi:hypothetical protein PR003_g4352 [Phytophthora rubi]|uniref:Uncharacterized protein n=3 Tax=Phytophthora TaxID=4783 RepID=A0A6A4FT48_9STRA|nr:hypothetical protein PR003_g4352 [Phytophthora rubi]